MGAFAYFRDPHHPLSSWSRAPARCYFCGNTGPGYGGTYHGPIDDLEHCCEACLRAGKLLEAGMGTNDGDLAAIRKQLAARTPELPEAEREALVHARSNELTYRTPQLVTWQDFEWPAHCGDFCEFVEELGKPEVIQLAGGEDPKAWLVARTQYGENAWEGIRESSARKKPADSFDLTVYRFVCRECGESVVHWDCS